MLTNLAKNELDPAYLVATAFSAQVVVQSCNGAM